MDSHKDPHAHIPPHASRLREASLNRVLPDVSLELKPEFYGRLSQVGMRDIQLPVRVNIDGEEQRLPGRLAALVSLDDPEAKGIHMSRLYLELGETLDKNLLSVRVLRRVLERFLASHNGLSQSATVELQFALPLKRKALVSELVGYRQYPVKLKADLDATGRFDFALETEILYSSTCPCSAALVQELLRKEFRHRFGDKVNYSASEINEWFKVTDNSVVAVPHAQRSLGRIKVKLDAALMLTPKYSTGLDFVRAHIDALETAVGTPVQAAVKRIDEQEFARLNGENLMFCEDAARKLRSALEANSDICDYDIYVEHQESLHPHNAVSRVVKGVAGGFRAE